MPAYRMQTLLEIRQRAEEEAKAAFSAAVQELVQAEKEQKRLEEELEAKKRERKARVEAHLREVFAKGAGIKDFNTMNKFEERLKDEEAQLALRIEAQKLVVKGKKQMVDQRRLEMAEASKEVKAIETHKDKWAMAVRKERDRREELAQEEIGGALHLARAKKT